MYSMVLFMAMSNGAATVDWQDGSTDSARYGNHLRHETERRRGGCHGGYGGCHGGYGYGGYGGCYGGYGYGGGYYPAPYRGTPNVPPPPPPPPRRGARYDSVYDGDYVYAPPARRGLLARRRAVAYDYGPPVAGTYYATYPDMMASSYQSFYPEQPEMLGGQREAPATMMVHLPPDAKLSVDDSSTKQTGSVRTFVTPALQPGKEFTYHMKATMMRDGKEVTETKDVKVRAGQETHVAFGGQGMGMSMMTQGGPMPMPPGQMPPGQTGYYTGPYDGSGYYPANTRRGILGRRRTGGGYYAPTGSYGPPMSSGYYAPPPGTAPDNYQSFYNAPQGNNSATLIVKLPADARLTIDDQPTRSSNTPRVFVTPPLQPNHEYTYHLKVSVMRDGKEVTEAKDAKVRAGQRTEVSIGSRGRDTDHDHERMPAREKKPEREEQR
jgi:uncharacterized protein (TIGR03000 family)